MFDLSQKVVIVTGASRGIGRGIAEVLASRGAHIVAAARGDNAAGTVEAIKGAGERPRSPRWTSPTVDPSRRWSRASWSVTAASTSS